jgi:hypothetical protein
LWPQFSHSNQPSILAAIGRNSFSSLQYGQRVIGSGRFGMTGAKL